MIINNCLDFFIYSLNYNLNFFPCINLSIIKGGMVNVGLCVVDVHDGVRGGRDIGGYCNIAISISFTLHSVECIQELVFDCMLQHVSA